MSKRNRDRMAQEAAQRASEAGRVLQSQRNVSHETSEPSTEPTQHDDSVRQGDDDFGGTIRIRNEPRRKAFEEIEQRDMESKEIVAPKEKEVIPENLPPPTAESMLQGGKFSEPDSVAQPDTSAEPETQPIQPADAAPVAATEPIKTVRVKVDGDEFDAPQSEVDDAGGVKSYQIMKASENRLKKANDALSQARQMQEAVVQFTRQNLPQQPAPVSDAQFISSKMDAIRYGTPEEGAAAMNEILQRKNPQIDQNNIINQSVAQMKYLEGVNKFVTEFSDISANPMLMKLVEREASERIAKIPADPAARAQVDWNDFYRRIGNEVRSVIGRPSQPAATPAAQTTGNPSQVSPDKEARKASIVNLPTASARAELPKETKPESRQDVINAMNKARGKITG